MKFQIQRIYNFLNVKSVNIETLILYLLKEIKKKIVKKIYDELDVVVFGY